MIYGTVYVLRLPKAYKVNIWTLARFNEQNFSEISPELQISLASLSTVLFAYWASLDLRRSKTNTRMCTLTHARSTLPQRRPIPRSPRGNDDSHYRLKARWPQCPYSAVLLSYQTALLYWCSIISFPLSFGVHQGVVAW